KEISHEIRCRHGLYLPPELGHRVLMYAREEPPLAPLEPLFTRGEMPPEDEPLPFEYRERPLHVGLRHAERSGQNPSRHGPARLQPPPRYLDERLVPRHLSAPKPLRNIYLRHKHTVRVYGLHMMEPLGSHPENLFSNPELRRPLLLCQL